MKSPQPDHDDYLHKLRHRLSPEPRSSVPERLLSNGFSGAEAEALVGDAVSGLRSENRGDGERFMIGILMLALASRCLRWPARVAGNTFRTEHQGLRA